MYLGSTNIRSSTYSEENPIQLWAMTDEDDLARRPCMINLKYVSTCITIKRRGL